MEKDERSESGNPIYRYKAGDKNAFGMGSQQDSHMEAICDHVEKHVGEIHSVFHELVSDQVHLDLHWVKATDDFPFHVLVTTGMSDKPMKVPPGLEEHQYAELCILLPAEWPIDTNNDRMKEIFGDENNYWPLRWLKTIARFPHEYNSWIGWGHTIPNGEGAEPFSGNTKMGCMLVHPSVTLPQEFFELKVNENKSIRFYCLIPIYKEEMEFKLKHGLDALLEKFSEYEVGDIIEVDRVNSCYFS